MIRMRPQPDTGEVLAGLVERVTYHNAENGFCVLRAMVRGHRDVVTVVGHAAAISAGEWIMASGQWVNDRTHGQQFKARFLRTSAPTSADGIERYLSSGMIRGVGPVYAKKLVRAFGERKRSSFFWRNSYNPARDSTKPLPIDYEQCCSDRLNPPPKADIRDLIRSPRQRSRVASEEPRYPALWRS
jgi:hypothetical protein